MGEVPSRGGEGGGGSSVGARGVLKELFLFLTGSFRGAHHEVPRTLLDHGGLIARMHSAPRAWQVEKRYLP